MLGGMRSSMLAHQFTNKTCVSSLKLIGRASTHAGPNAARLRPPFGVRAYSPRARLGPIRRVNLNDEPVSVTASPGIAQILDEPVVVIERQLEIGSVLLGFEQGRIFRLYRPDGTPLGHMEEVDFGISKAIMRQITRLHRPFTVRVFDSMGNHALTIQRPFSFINSHIRCLLPAGVGGDESDSSLLLGESQQEWHLWRRRYNLYVASQSRAGPGELPNQLPSSEASAPSMNQFGRVDAPFLSFQFPVADEGEKILGSIDRNWTGIGREIFTDTGVYFLRFSPDRVAESLLDPNTAISRRPLSLTERVVMLATATSIDFDYFSRHSNRGPMMFPFFGDDV